MAFSEELRRSVGPLWEKTVTHPFVVELGDGTLPQKKFDLYFQQDYLFLRDLVSLVCGGIVKAPDFASARPLAAFVHALLVGEESLFQQYFRDAGLSQEAVGGLKYLPTSLAYSSFLGRVASEGTFHEIVTTLLGIEWPYLDWAQRLAAANKRPENRYYQLWIDIHVSKDLEELVFWLQGVLDGAALEDGAGLNGLFLSALRYEYLFWEMAYKGEEWPV